MSGSDRNGPGGAGRLERLRGNDAVFLYAETPTMPMHTMGTLILDPAEMPGGFGFENVRHTLETRIHRMPPFRTRVLEVPLGLGHPLRADDPDFRLENHLHRAALPAPGGMRELAELVGDIAGRLLERDKPLWEMWVVEGVEGGRLALVTKLHHCIMDGASGSSQMASLLDLSADAEPPPPPDEPWRPAPLPGAFERARLSAGSRIVGPRRLSSLAFDTARGLVGRLRAERANAREGAVRAGWLGPRTVFNRTLTTHRCVAFGSLPLADVKRVKNAFGVTVNDAVLAAFTLGLRRYLLARDALPDQPLLCGMPVSLKSSSEREEFSNKVTSVAVALPTHLSDPQAVVEAVHRDTVAAKAVLGAVEADLMPAWLELAPPIVTQLGMRLFSGLHVGDRMPPLVNVLLSNVMGPPVPLFFGGARVEAVYPMGPVGEGMGLNLTVLSNMGRLDLGLLACRESVPDPWHLLEAITKSVRDLT